MFNLFDYSGGPGAWSSIEGYMIFIWLTVFIIAIIVEFATSELVSIWFAGGSIIGLILSCIGGVPYWAEIIVFIVVSAMLLLLLRPLTRKFLMRNGIASNVDELIGKKATVLKGMDELNYGEVKVYGVIWTAVSSEGAIINKDDVVEILSIDGNKLIVKKVEK